jgi:hypothetical protein
MIIGEYRINPFGREIGRSSAAIVTRPARRYFADCLK